MLFAQVTDKGREELKTALSEAQEVKWYRRLKIIDLSAQGHRVPELAPFWEEHWDRIEPVFLPTYNPHLNLIERLWNYMRGQITRNQFYESLKVQCQAITDWLATLPFSRFCSLMGIDEADLQFSCQSFRIST